MTTPDAVERFAGFVLGSDYASLPEPAREAAKVFFLDSIGVGIAGCRVDSALRVRRAAKTWGRGRAATVLGTGERLPATSAAFVNSFQVHCQEFDCLHERATVHAMAVLTGALLAVAEERDCSGEQLILGVALGVEVATALGLAATRGLGFFRPATAGALGATAALARLAGLDREAFLDAWGLAYSQLAGTMQAHVEGSVALPVQVAAAARAAVTSLQLAENGLGGPHDILEGPFGYFRLFEPGGDIAPVLDSLGRTWRITELSHKPFPTGRAAHGTLEALERFHRHRQLGLDDLVELNAFVPPLVRRLVARPVKPDMSANYARLCLGYLVPTFLREGRIDTGSFSDELLRDDGLLAAGAAVHVIDDGNPDPNALGPQRIEILLQDGSRLEESIPHTLGSPENPLSREAYLGKFRHCLAVAGIDKGKAKRLEELLESLEAVSSAAELTRLCHP